MVPSASNNSQDSKNLSITIVEWIADVGIKGLGVLPSAETVARDHLKSSHGNKDAAIRSIFAGEQLMEQTVVSLQD